MYPLTQWSLGKTLMFVVGTMTVVFASSVAWCLYVAESARTASWILGGMAAATLAVWLVVTICLERSVLAPLRAIAATISRIDREADLTLRLPVGTNPDLAQLASAVNSLLGGFAASFAEVHGNADRVADASTTVASSSSRLAAQAAAQSEAAASTATAVEQMTARVAQVRDSASEVRCSSTENHVLSKQGGAVIGNATAEMTNIADAVRAASSSVAELGRHSDQISDIVHVIKEIADQTNLLALNAAIEAARAGEQGRGFAVVADEVRRLAERTASSTGEISSMIERIQSGVRHTTETMETGVARVDHGVTLARQAGTAIARIHDGAGKVSTAVSDISGALCEQAAAGTDISRRVETIAQMSAENTDAVHSSAQAAKSAAQAAAALKSVASRYRIGAQA